MKSIEDLEKLGWEELERSAMQDPAPIPEGLQQRIAASLAAKSLAGEASARKFPVRTVSFTALAAAAALAAVLVLPKWGTRQPKDTFDDPYLAYADLCEHLSNRIKLIRIFSIHILQSIRKCCRGQSA